MKDICNKNENIHAFKIWYDSGFFCLFHRVIFIFKLIALYLLDTEIWYDGALFSTTKNFTSRQTFHVIFYY